ncbi:amidohydrolase family protein [Spongiactinospora sp. TRM90649]|uniref:amidohydrolase n=1 Tax=Spongiactinospora sp. TRM90649 TaxID=3031114 RepID=UPI0023F7C9D6|nr:amidohydrolase family protein [Spongiactinospora sp. TRM90649]MDF5758876.1 amidohydrolase family protein [Spongiactinospora sp. TRM90649]
MNEADLVLVNGRVLTMDPARPTAPGLAVRDGKIVHVGDASGWTGTEVVDLRGRVVLPGINDSHLHACGYGLHRPPFCLDVALGSIAEVRETVAEAVRRAGPGEWIRGTGWNPGRLAEHRMPGKADLDDVAPHHPVVLQDFSGHTTWANSRALELAGLSGEGLLQHGDQGLVQGLVPPPQGGMVRVLREVLAELNGYGITSFTEPGLGPGGGTTFAGGMGADVLSAYAELARAGELTARVSVLGLPSGMSGASVEDTAAYLADLPKDLDGVDERVLRLLGVKVFADGIPPTETAWMREPYPSGAHGSLCTHGATDAERVAELDEILRLVHLAGLQAGVHVVGSRGIDAVVEALATISREHPRHDARHYVIHGQYASASALATLGELGYGINLQPVLQAMESGTTRDMFGAEAAEREWPARSAIDAGVLTACSSDAPVTGPDWRVGVAALTARDGEGISLTEALGTYTVAGARQDFAETWKGTLGEGMAADLFVSGATDVEEVVTAPVELTVFDGRVVWSGA